MNLAAKHLDQGDASRSFDAVRSSEASCVGLHASIMDSANQKSPSSPERASAPLISSRRYSVNSDPGDCRRVSLSSNSPARSLLPKPHFEQRTSIETGQPPHYLAKLERSLLQQALDDHSLEEELRRLQAQSCKLRAKVSIALRLRTSSPKPPRHPDDSQAPAPPAPQRAMAEPVRVD